MFMRPNNEIGQHAQMTNYKRLLAPFVSHTKWMAIGPTDLRAPRFLGQGGPKPLYVEWMMLRRGGSACTIER
jgi:hypothetical protein